jgi:hypothetical protein
VEGRFEGSRLKIERARTHLAEFYNKFSAFSRSEFYSLRVEHDPDCLTSELCVNMDLAGLEIKRLGPIIGDILHNLRSSLDLMYEVVVLSCGGVPTRKTRFPIFESRQELENVFINSALQQRQITKHVAHFLVSEVSPYRGGNESLWALHELNIVDKHKALLPVIELVAFIGVRLENDGGVGFPPSEFLAERTCRIRIHGSYRQNITLKSKGHASANVIFNVGAPAFQGETIFPTLKTLAEAVTAVIDKFEQTIFR